MTSVGRYARTVGPLRPAQIGHRLRLRGQRALLSRVPAAGRRLARPVPLAWGWPAGHLPLDGRAPTDPARAEAMATGRFTFLHEDRALGSPPEWQPTDASQLWRYQLHDFEWAWSFVGHPDRAWAAPAFAGLVRSWQASNPVGRWDAWSPYATSLRAWALCGIHPHLVSGTPWEGSFVASLALHAGYLRWHLERDVGGNHLVKNLKAVVGVGVFLDDGELVELGARDLVRQVERQVLDDGGHFERSPSYHAQVLGDLVDCVELLDAAAVPVDATLTRTIAAMRTWLGAMVLPDGDVPLLNDCQPVGRQRLALLGAVPPPPRALHLLEPSGYVVVRPDDRFHLVLDVGLPCPPELPAHAHADTLALHVSVDGARLLVDTGTSAYQDVAVRAHERSTAAHNTVEIDGSSSTEVWGAFRTGRRAAVSVESCRTDEDGIEVAASHDGYRHLPGHPTVRRRLRARRGRVTVTDEIEGRGRHAIVSSWHVAPSVAVVRRSPTEVQVGPALLRSSHPVEIEPAVVGLGFGQRASATRLVVRVEEALPARLELEILLPEG